MALPIESRGPESWANPKLIRTLLLDDSSFDRARIKRMSGRTDLEVELTEVGDIAGMRAAVDHEQFDLILIDYRLPEGTGLDVLAYLQASPLNSDAAMIMITGEGDMQTAVTAMRRGCHDYLTKDAMTPVQLRTAVKGALQAAQTDRAQALRTAQQTEVIRQGLTAALMEPAVQNTVVSLFRDEVGRALDARHPVQDHSALEALLASLQDDEDTFIFE